MRGGSTQEKTGHRQDRSESENWWHRGGESGQESDDMSKGTRHVMGEDRRKEEAAAATAAAAAAAATTEGNSQNQWMYVDVCGCM